MNSYTVQVKPAARKELEALPDNVLARVVHKIESLGDSPRPAACKKLKGYKDQWRIRVGDWRVVYILDDATEARQRDPDRAPARSLRLAERRQKVFFASSNECGGA